jgi:amino-acid N-acetyltransferase
MTTAESVPPPTPTQFVAQRARIPDVPGIHRLIQHWADTTGDVLARTEGEIYETLRDFFVVRDGTEILAAGALHIEWKSLAEVKSLVVSPAAQGQGLGRLIVHACLAEALALDIRTVFALSTSPEFFERLGFQQAAVSAFPRKVWNECFRCPKYAHCDEVALSLDLQTADLSALSTPARD